MAAETKFTGTDTYVASDDLLAAVEVATKDSIDALPFDDELGLG